MTRKEKNKKAGRFVAAVPYFFGMLVFLSWSSIMFFFFNTPLGRASAAGFLVVAIWSAFEGVLRLLIKLRKRESKWWIIWGVACLVLTGLLVYFAIKMILLEQSFEMFLIITIMCLFPAYLFAFIGVSRIREVVSKPEKTGKPGGRRKWWPIRFFIFIGPVLYGVSATTIKGSLVKKRTSRSGPLNNLRLLLDTLRERVSRTRHHSLGKALVFVKALKVSAAILIIVLATVLSLIVGFAGGMLIGEMISPAVSASAFVLLVAAVVIIIKFRWVAIRG